MKKYNYQKNVKFINNSLQEEIYHKCLKKYFKLEELLNQELINNYDEKALQFIDSSLLRTIYFIREYYKLPMRINDYKLNLFNRVVRFPDSDSYSPTSQHACIIDKSGNIIKRSSAVDFDILNKLYTADYVRNDIIKNKDLAPFSNITRIEEDVNWVHIDLKPLSRDEKRIHLIYPK